MTNRIRTFIVAALSLFALAGALPPAEAAGQTKSIKEQLAGSWSLVSISGEVAGKKVDLYGPDPIGRLILDPGGTFSMTVFRPGLPRIASNNPMQGTPEEYRAIVQGSNAFFGTYTVDGAGKNLVFHVEFSTYPNWNGDVQQRSFTLDGNELRYVNPRAPMGTLANIQTVWKRIPPMIPGRYECRAGICYGNY